MYCLICVAVLSDCYRALLPYCLIVIVYFGLSAAVAYTAMPRPKPTQTLASTIRLLIVDLKVVREKSETRNDHRADVEIPYLHALIPGETCGRMWE